jgi:hypothetical protein
MTKRKQPVHSPQSVLDKLVTRAIAQEKIRVGTDETNDAPFATMTWKDWQETQEQVEQSLIRFREAVEEKKSSRVLMATMEMLEAMARMFLEAYAQGIDEDLDLEPIPQG